jgi:hydroxymethylpyrimidine/phosphomethylpyrimidine kinase
MAEHDQTPVALTIAGSDSSGGAGIQADLKTFTVLGVYGASVLTALTAQNTRGVTAIHPVPARFVTQQIDAVAGDLRVAAVKTGMLYDRDTVLAVVEGVRRHRLSPLVVDPVMVATSGDPLLRADAVALYRERLFSRATLVTPNLDEVRTLLGRPVTSLDEMRRAGIELAAEFGTNFLIKGGHLREAVATDLLCEAGGAVHEFSAPFVPGVSTHGTGCTYAAAITAGLGKGLALRDAVGEAKVFLTCAVANFLSWERPGGRTDALHHFAK